MRLKSEYERRERESEGGRGGKRRESIDEEEKKEKKKREKCVAINRGFIFPDHFKVPESRKSEINARWCVVDDNFSSPSTVLRVGVVYVPMLSLSIKVSLSFLVSHSYHKHTTMHCPDSA